VTDCDIAIVGGGLVGAPLALALAEEGHRVALLERQVTPAPLPTDALDQRCTALSAGSREWLERRGLWSALAEDACPIRTVHVSHRGRFGSTRLTAAEHGVDALGHVVENRRVLVALDVRLTRSGVRRLVGVSVERVEPGTDDVRVGYVSSATPVGTDAGEGSSNAGAGGTLRARLVVGVDGIDSSVRAALGIGVRRHDYRQSAVLGTLALEREHGHVAHERFTDSGPLALLPRPDRTVSFVECVARTEASRIAGLGEEAFLERLQRRFGRRLGRFVASGPRSVQSLVRIEAERQVGPRTVLLGNAARLLHPVAGQGYNLALRDAAALVTALAPGGSERGLGRRYGRAEIPSGTDPGDPARLAAFVAARRADQRRTVALTDTLARVFRGESAALGRLRAFGLVGLDTVSPLRRRFARSAMGGATPIQPETVRPVSGESD